MSHNKQNFVQKLRELGYRVTPQRQLIMDTLCEMGGHATINQIYERVHDQAPAIDRATVYRAIHLFHEHQFVHSADFNGRTMYEIAETQPHHHLVCRECQQVISLSDHHFDYLADHLRREHGFYADINHITIHGLCAPCQERVRD